MRTELYEKTLSFQKVQINISNLLTLNVISVNLNFRPIGVVFNIRR